MRTAAIDALDHQLALHELIDSNGRSAAFQVMRVEHLSRTVFGGQDQLRKNRHVQLQESRSGERDLLVLAIYPRIGGRNLTYGSRKASAFDWRKRMEMMGSVTNPVHDRP